jgi:hypothetical protein
MINDPTLNSLIEISLDGALCDIANVIYYLYKDDYVSARLKNKLWFKYDGLKWKQIEEGPYYELSKTVLNYYEQYTKRMIENEYNLKQGLKSEHFESEKSDMETKLKKINNDIQKGNIIIDKLKNVNFKESICKECLYLFYNPEFIFNLDKKEHLVCFKNVVYDVKNNNVKVPEKDDMISIYIDVEYVEPTEKEDTDSLNELIEKFSSFRKNLLKKRHPKNVYNLATY